VRGKTTDHGECLAEDTLTDYLEGGLDPALKAASEVHLIACDSCRKRLGFYMQLLNEDVSPEEAGTVEAIAARWDKQKPKENSPRRAGTFKRRFVMCAAVAATLVITFVSVHQFRLRVTEPKSAGEVVQLLLSQQRPFESRLSNQPHLTATRTRGADKPNVAYSVLAGEMTRLSADSHEMGRFYLLQKDFSRATQYLEIAEREVGEGAAVHNDLGVAYLESGTSIEKAEQELQHALKIDPAFLPAVFNLAVFCERTGAPGLAQAHFRRYLQLDPNSPWAAEAQARLQALSR
jgi:tetratricopeptide (TPR) repeat protein